MTTFILRNGLFRTGDPRRPLASSMLVEHGLIALVGDDLANPHGVPEVDLRGRTVVPGFVDAHCHPGSVARSGWHVRLPWTEDRQELLEFIQRYAQEHPATEQPMLYFEYYPGAMFREALPTKELLDSVVRDRPVLCQHFGEHEHWVNSRMLELMGVTRDTPDPVPGLRMFVRDDDGEPTGLLRENVHEEFLPEVYRRLGWKPHQDLSPESIGPFLNFLRRRGVVAVFDAVIEDEQMVAAVADLDRRGELGMYYEGALQFSTREDLPRVLKQVASLQASYGGPHVRVRTVKLFLDGTNELGTSALLPTGGHGADHLEGLAMSPEDLTGCLLACSDADVDMHIHVVGDRGFRAACDAVAMAQAACAESGESWRTQVTLAHCELVDPADMGRPAELGIIINWTPHWSGGYFGDTAHPVVGAERWNRMYRFTEMAASGATIAFSSDVVTQYEAHRADPLFGMQVGATRLDPEFPLDADRWEGGLRPEPSARLSTDLLLTGYTSGGARQLRLDDRLGILAAGRPATMAVLDADPLSADPAALMYIDVAAVLFEGRVTAGSL